MNQRQRNTWLRTFEDEGDALFFGGTPAASSPKIKINWLGARKAAPGQGGSIRESRVAAVKRKLASVVKRSPQVMVKVTGNTKGAQHMGQHLDYISRNGELEGGLEDQDGNIIDNQDGINDLKEDWRTTGYPILTNNSKTIDTYSIIFSMPEGTDPLAVKRAVRDFAEVEFKGFQYVMALHTQETDPDPKPSPHPHVHLTIKARSLDEGYRLRPEVSDIHRWREGFAEALRTYGVEAQATTRSQRLKMERGEQQYVPYMKERNEPMTRKGVETPKRQKRRWKGSHEEQRARWSDTEEKVVKHYGQIVASLEASPDHQDKRLAEAVGRRLGSKVQQAAQQARIERDQDLDRGR